MLLRKLAARLVPLMAVTIAGLTLFASQPAAAAINHTYNYETGMSGWQIGYDGDAAWQMARSRDEAYRGQTSVECYLDGTTGFGTAWLARGYSAPMDTLMDVKLSFQLWSAERGDVNQAAVVAYVGTAPPTSRADFQLIGYTNQVAGWQQYQFDRLQLTGQDPAQVWVAFGVSSTWEYASTFYMDYVKVSLQP
jgi:hypothetical protein